MIQRESIITADLQYITDHTGHLWPLLKGKTVFVTGGTGFFGIWLLKSFLFANARLQLQAKLVILTRSADSFLSKFPELKDQKELQFIVGDVRSFEFPPMEVHYIIHAASETNINLHIEKPLEMLDIIVQGTRHVLDFAAYCKAKAVLFTSSGAVYGKQPSDISHLEETFNGAPQTHDAGATYAEGKRMAELLSSLYHKQYNLDVKIARCFAFVGPYLPLDGSFAIGNFIKNVIEQNDILIKGDGTPVRSYLYAADLCIWLWTILLKGKIACPYNVGSDDAHSLRDIAALVAEHGNNSVHVQHGNTASLTGTNRYVPSIEKAKNELGLEVGITLEKAIQQTVEFYRLTN
ncbi:NAD-dependent epimerase/dehydratase family protein [Niastella sp. OAS944]|uniref:NAD-dependent epimerase/dehydratase family protein n=1 Tax=Niastella sp. OAS944 TaxID=2664089 RepID=UPI00348D4F99|nr:dTDP-glucose 4,6-dehydratase [Chitinophagaceae bacterium OAS944]